jgi:pSer/pThr/pTyr-binding forkhead associated (FHA) protein
VADVVLFAGRLILLALLYLFLLAAVRTGIGLIGQSHAASAGLRLTVVKGPRELSGKRVAIRGPIVIGRSPGADIVISGDFVSSRHARVTPTPSGATVEDLGSTNGTIVNGSRVLGTTPLQLGDVIDIGDVRLQVEST